MALEFVATTGQSRGTSMVVLAPAVGRVVRFRLEGLLGSRIEKFSVGNTTSDTSLEQQTDLQVEQRFATAGLTEDGSDFDAVHYDVTMTPGMVHHAEVEVVGTLDGEPYRQRRRVLVVGAAEPVEDPRVMDISASGTRMTAFVPLFGPPGQWMAAGLTATPADGGQIAHAASVIDVADQTVSIALTGPPLRPGHLYFVDVVLVDSAGVSVRVARDEPVRLRRRVVTVSLSRVTVIDDLDAGTAGDFRLYLRLLGRLRAPTKDVEHAMVGSTGEFKLDSVGQPNQLKIRTLPVWPDTRDFTIVDGPTSVEEDRYEVWVSVVASESDAGGTERASGTMRLYVPNTSPLEQSSLEEIVSEPLRAWDPGDRDPFRVPVAVVPDGDPLELWTDPIEDPPVHALTVHGTYSVRYVT